MMLDDGSFEIVDIHHERDNFVHHSTGIKVSGSPGLGISPKSMAKSGEGA